MRLHSPRLSHRSLAWPLVAAFVLAGTLAGPAAPVTRASTTTSALEASILSWANRDRALNGLVPLRIDAHVRTIAQQRATNLTAASTFSHAAAGGDIGAALSSAAVRWYGWGEVIGMAGGGTPATMAAVIYNSWKHSSSHWPLLMSRTFNYVGVGVAIRADGAVFSSVVFSESPDHSAPTTRFTSRWRVGRAASWAWRVVDPALQTHWAGVRNVDIRLRVGAGAWRMIRIGVLNRSITLYSLARGRTYWLSVRGRDRVGNVGAWSAAWGVTIP